VCLATMGKRIVAGLIRSVRVYDYNEMSNGTVAFKDLAHYRVTAYPVDIDVHGNVIAVADLMKSVSLVEFTPPSADGQKGKLVETDRHFQSCWTTAVRHIGDKTWLETEADGHLLVLRQRESGISDYARLQMELTSEFNLGEQVNSVRTLDVSPSEGCIVTPRAFLATVRASTSCSSSSAMLTSSALGQRCCVPFRDH
jgi:DNA damage-binding protein 1